MQVHVTITCYTCGGITIYDADEQANGQEIVPERVAHLAAHRASDGHQIRFQQWFVERDGSHTLRCDIGRRDDDLRDSREGSSSTPSTVASVS